MTLKSFADKHLQGDPVIWFVVFVLSVVSILVVYSATGTLAFKEMSGNTEYYLFKHSLLVVLSFGVMWIAHKIDYRYYSKLAMLALWISVPLLIITWQFGDMSYQASRSLTIPIIKQSFQTSDFAKFALIASLASMLSKRQQSIDDFKKALIPILLWCGVICGLIGMVDMSSAVLLFATCMLLMFIGRVPIKYLLMLVLIGGLAGAVAMKVGQRGDTVIGRVERFLDPEYIHDQTKHAYIAISTGGVAGKGPGNSDQRNFLPNPYADFIYAILVEEYGMIGGVFMILLYLTLLYRGMKAVSQSHKAFGGLLSAGLSFALVLQAMVNMGVAVGLGPITGLPLPFVSMGGTSLLFTGLALGVVLSVSRGEIAEVGVSTGKKKNLKKAA